VLVAGEVRVLVELQDELADLLAPPAHLDAARARLLGRLGVLGEQRDVAVGVPRVERPAVAGVQLLDERAVLGRRSWHVSPP
jgi:hypothetical protein